MMEVDAGIDASLRSGDGAVTTHCIDQEVWVIWRGRPPHLPIMASYIVGSSQVFSASSDADSIWIQSGGAVSTVYGLAGADTISIDGVNDANDVGTVARGGDGADLFNVQSGSFSAGGSQFFGGSGSDTIILSEAPSPLNTTKTPTWLMARRRLLSAASFSTGTDTLDIGSGTIELQHG